MDGWMNGWAQEESYAMSFQESRAICLDELVATELKPTF